MSRKHQWSRYGCITILGVLAVIIVAVTILQVAGMALWRLFGGEWNARQGRARTKVLLLRKGIRQVRKPIVGPDVAICDESTWLGVEILQEELPDWKPPERLPYREPQRRQPPLTWGGFG